MPKTVTDSMQLQKWRFKAKTSFGNLSSHGLQGLCFLLSLEALSVNPYAKQPIWQRMHSLSPAGSPDTCQKAIFSSSQWERQEPGSNPQLKRLEQNNSARITEHELVWLHFCVFFVSACVLKLLKVCLNVWWWRCSYVCVLLFFMGFWHLLQCDGPWDLLHASSKY